MCKFRTSLREYGSNEITGSFGPSEACLKGPERF